RRPPAEPRLCDGSPVVRDVRVIHEPGARADRTAQQRREDRHPGADAAEEARRGSRAAAPREAWSEAHQADAGSGEEHRRVGGRAVQAGTLSVLRQRKFEVRSSKEVRSEEALARVFRKAVTSNFKLRTSDFQDSTPKPRDEKYGPRGHPLRGPLCVRRQPLKL